MEKIDIIKRLYFDYSKKHIKKILFSLFFALLVAGSTSAIAYLLDPAIKKIFIEKDQTLIIIIPIFIYYCLYSKRLCSIFSKNSHDQSFRGSEKRYAMRYVN